MHLTTHLYTLLLFSKAAVFAGGISTDAGLTPPQDRWILRTQFRTMSMKGSSIKMNTQMIPLVIAYGITPKISLMLRSMYVRKSSGNKQGLNDLYLLSKFRLYRKNTARYVIGVAPHIASNIPIGTKGISNRTWNPEFGLNVSYKPRFLTIDLSTSYTLIDMLKKNNSIHSNQYSLNIAFSGNIPRKSKSKANQVISPVVEFNYVGIHNKHLDPNQLLMISPGISFVNASFTIEALYQIPIFQSQNDNNTIQRPRFLLGLKYMF